MYCDVLILYPACLCSPVNMPLLFIYYPPYVPLLCLFVISSVYSSLSVPYSVSAMTQFPYGDHLNFI